MSSAGFSEVKRSAQELYDVILQLSKCAVEAVDMRLGPNNVSPDCKSAKLFFKSGEIQKREQEVSTAIGNLEAMKSGLSSANSTKLNDLFADIRAAKYLFLDLTNFLKPIKANAVTTNTFQAYTKLVQEVMRKKIELFMEERSPAVLEMRQRTPILKTYAEQDAKYVQDAETAIKTMKWDKASKAISTMKMGHNQVVSSRLASNPMGIRASPGLYGSEVERPALVAFPNMGQGTFAESPRPSQQRPPYIPNVPQRPAYIPSPTDRVAVPLGGRSRRKSSKRSTRRRRF